MVKPKGVIYLDLFDIQVGVFCKEENRMKYYRSIGHDSISEIIGQAKGSAYCDVDSAGVEWYSLVIPKKASAGTRAHECVHIADWVMDAVGIPTGEENTEVRGYLVGYMVACLSDILGDPGK